MRLRLLTASLSALLVFATAFAADPTPASAPAAAAPAKVTAAELAYWTQLQTDLSDLRTANLSARIRTIPLEARAEDLSAIASRLEKFLDRRDKDPVSDLGPDFKDYRERVDKLVELALEPVTASAKFKSALITDGEERMMKAFQISTQIKALEDSKPRLAQLHEQLNARVVAAGGPPRFFFQTLGIGDRAAAPGTLGTPGERDTQFVSDAKAIGSPFAAIAKGHFVATRLTTGLSDGLADSFVDAVSKFHATYGDSPPDLFVQALEKSPTFSEPADSFNLKRHLLELEILRHDDIAAYTVAMQEFQGAIQRWLGKIDDVAPLGLCRDVAVAQDGSWFAYAPAANSIVIRNGADGKVRATLKTGGAVRALAAAPDNKLMLFTTEGLFFADATSATPEPAQRSGVKTAFIEPRIASSHRDSNWVFALGIKPGLQRGDVEHTFSVERSASRVTAVATSADNLTVAYGYAADNVTGSGEPNSGYAVLKFTGEPDEFEKRSSTQSRQVDTPIVSAVLSLAMSEDGQRVAGAWFGRYGGAVTYDDLSGEKTKRAVLAVDADPYNWVQLIDAAPRRVVAGTRTGNVRVWDAGSRDLLATFAVPAGPSGVAYGVVGGELVSVALGQPGAHRWKLDGALVASYDGEVAKPDPAALAERLKSERELLPARETFVAALDPAIGDERVKYIDILRGPQAKLVERLGMKPMVDRWYGGLRGQQISALNKDKRHLEAFELGAKEIGGGAVDNYLVYITLFVGNQIDAQQMTPELRQRLQRLGERAIALYPLDVDINQEYREMRYSQFAQQGKVREALKEIDELDSIDPGNAPHNSRRYYVLMMAYDFANKAGQQREAMQILMDSTKYTDDEKEQLMLANNIFAIACRLKEWKIALNSANNVLRLDEAMKNDESFMYWARYAYAQVNPPKK